MFHEHGWILGRATLSSEQIALIDVHTSESWTYEQLRKRVLRWVCYFDSQSCQPGDRIAIYAPNQPELFAILFACELRGFLYVPLNWRLSRSELELLLADCSPILLLYDPVYIAHVKPIQCQASVVSLAVIDEVTAQEVIFEPTLAVTEPWMLIYTGGTTGVPKGVVLSRQAVNWNALNTITSWGLSEKDTTINYMPLFHTGGLNALSIPLLMAGGTVVVGHQFDPIEALQATNEYEATISLFVPTMYQTMIRTNYFADHTFPTMDVFLSGGAPCPTSIYEAFQRKGLRFKEGYGLTEAGPNNFYIRPERAMAKVGSIGKRMIFNDIKVVNGDGQQCPTGEIGELYVRGPHLFSGYWNRPEETAAVLEEGWLRTGDLAKQDEDADYYIVGRKKDMIITGGENVYPQEVEQCILRSEAVQEVAVVGMEDEKWGERIVAFVVPTSSDVQVEPLKAHCKALLASYKVPKHFVFLQELPKTPVGKIDKKTLQQMMYQNDSF